MNEPIVSPGGDFDTFASPLGLYLHHPFILVLRTPLGGLLSVCPPSRTGQTARTSVLALGRHLRGPHCHCLPLPSRLPPQGALGSDQLLHPHLNWSQQEASISKGTHGASPTASFFL